MDVPYRREGPSATPAVYSTQVVVAMSNSQVSSSASAGAYNTPESTNITADPNSYA